MASTCVLVIFLLSLLAHHDASCWSPPATTSSVTRRHSASARCKETAGAQRCAIVSGSAETSDAQHRTLPPPDYSSSSSPTGASSRLLVYWKGESLENYSLGFRSLEFRGAIRAVLRDENTDRPLRQIADDDLPITFTNALSTAGTAIAEDIAQRQIDGFHNALQYVDYDADVVRTTDLVQAASRCSLVHSIYEIGSTGTSYDNIVENALNDDEHGHGCFDDMKEGGDKERSSWRFRLRHFALNRFGARTTHSSRREKEALAAMGPNLLAQYNGPVKLNSPEIRLVLFEGLGESGNDMVLTRNLVDGADAAVMKPTTRMCVTNTPLCPLASFVMCNVAEVRRDQTVLDLYAGSCATLLAATLIEPTVRCVGIEIAHDGLVSRADVIADFASRGRHPPRALIEGDANEADVREKARAAIGGEAFDVIVSDPPYGIRESLASINDHRNPTKDVFRMISCDREKGRRLLKTGGRLVLFVPCSKDEELGDISPNAEEEEGAGLRRTVEQRQQLNDVLSRWLVAYECVS